MVTEFAEIEIKAGMEAQFIAGVEASRKAFARSEGCHGLALHRSIEKPTYFVLQVKWESVAHHMEKFRGAAEFQEWRGNVGACFAAAPKVWHSETVVGE
jgi:quinol monooxygenase YgiN